MVLDKNNKGTGDEPVPWGMGDGIVRHYYLVTTIKNATNIGTTKYVCT